MPGYIHKPGPVGVISRSGTLTYEAVWQLVQPGPGPIDLRRHRRRPDRRHDRTSTLLKLFQDDPQTEAILMMGEIGGTAEEQAAEFVKKHVTKPVAAFIAGQTAPPGKRMGHAGAIISGGSGTAKEKIAALRTRRHRRGRQPGGPGRDRAEGDANETLRAAYPDSIQLVHMFAAVPGCR